MIQPADLQAPLAVLDERLRHLESVLVAFSGGADSAFLLAAAVRSLGASRVLAATSTSASLASGEWAAAHRFADDLGVEHVAVGTDEFERPGYTANGPDRCYHCKSALGDELTTLAAARGFAAVATGTNADDLAEPHRPGLRASRERGVVTPLADAGLTKAQIRAASAHWGLPTWDKPQAACLASRVAYGVTVDPDRLARVDRAERALRAALTAARIEVRNLRVRDLGDRARVEVDASALGEVASRLDVPALMVGVGFAAGELDPRGFRSGSLNDDLSAVQRHPGPARASSWDLPLVEVSGHP